MANFVGGTGNDTFNGGADNDTATGNAGADVLNGGEGDDILYSDAALGSYRIPYYGNPYETPVLDRANVIDTVTGGEGDDILSVGYGDNADGGDGNDLLFVSFQGVSSGVTFDLNATSQTIGGGTIQNIESAVWIEGSEHNDTITDILYDPLSTTNTIFGMGGDDSIVGGAMTGDILGGDGNDIIDIRLSQTGNYAFGGAGNDTVYSEGSAFGDDGDDLLNVKDGARGGAGNDTFVVGYSAYGGAFINGGEGNDSIDNSAGAGPGSQLAGEAGDDVVRGGVENDFLWGGAGNDTLIGGSDWGEDPFGGPFGDVAIYRGSSTDFRVTEDAGTHVVTIVDLRDGSPEGTDTLDSIETLQFTNGNFLLADLLSDTEVVPDNFVGTTDNDGYVGNGNNNTAVGDAGNDSLGGKAGNDTLEGDAGNDTLDGGNGDDVLYSDMPTGYYVRPYFGNPYTIPVLDRGSEADALNGGSGSDFISAGYGDNVDGGDGSDVLVISFQGATSGVYFDGTLTSQVIGGATIQNVEYFNWIEGSDYDDTLIDGYGFANYAPIFGMGGNDHLVGGYYTGSLFGGEGNDTLDGTGSAYGFPQYGGAGDDVYMGGGQAVEEAGEGTDTLVSVYGGALGNNIENLTLTGSNTADGTGNELNNVLTGNDGNNTLTGGAGNDTITGGADAGDGETTGDIAVYSGNRADYLATEDAGTHLVTIVDLRDGSPDGSDTLDHTIELVQFADSNMTLADLISGVVPVPNDFVGDGSHDSYGGNARDNTAVGNGGDDTLGGKAGNDTLEGDAGADALDGGAGDDRIYSDGPLGSPYDARQLDRAADVDTLTGGDGNDTLSAGYGDNVDGGDGGDVLYISFQGASQGVVFDGTLFNQTVGGATISNIENYGSIEGSQFDDTLTDSFGYSYGSYGVLAGMGGNDHLIATYYSTNLDGGEGNDTVDGRNSQYLWRVAGGDGDDVLYTATNTTALADGGAGNDTIYAHGAVNGGAGDDSIQMVWSYYPGQVHGDDGNDTIDGSALSSATLYGDAGDDSLTGGGGIDRLEGGAGNDTISGGADDGNGETSGDTVIYSGNLADYLVTEDANTHLVTIVDLRDGSPDGSDTLDHTIELIQFADFTLTLAEVIAGVVPEPDSFVGTAEDDSYGGNGHDNTAVGYAGDDTLGGKGGNDTLEGNAGADTLEGGTGEDVLYSDMPPGYYELPYFGNPYTIPELDRGNEADTLNGGSGNDFISAGYGDNVDGGDGSDLLMISFQGASSGVYFNLNLTSQVIGGATIQNIESVNWIEGSEYNDTIIDSGNNPYTPFAPIFGMGGNDSLVGGYYTGSMFGGEGNDTLNGTGSAYGFPLYGGVGDDVYLGGDHAVEVAGEGTDTVVSAYATFLGENIENLTLTGSYGVDGIGNELNNRLLGNDGDNHLYGGYGHDWLDGAGGSDTLTGGAGNDTYVVNSNVDVIVEYSGEGTDVVRSSISYVLGDNVETLLLVGSAALSGTGNDLNNTLIGNGGDNQLFGLAGHDRLLGGLGNDTLSGGIGNDTYVISDTLDVVVEAAGEGVDLVASAVSFVLGADVENLTLTGVAAIDGTGNDGDNVLTGNGGNNHLFGGAGDDRIIGKGGEDTMRGGADDDTYVVDSRNDKVFEGTDQGTDLVVSSVKYTLGANVENLTLTGSATRGTGNSLDNILRANDLGNRLEGGAGDDVLFGGASGDVLKGDLGNDKLIGGLGRDTVFGGSGDDSYWVEAGDELREFSDDGTDIVYAATSFRLATGQALENLTLTGTGDTAAIGNELGNVLRGNSGNNRLDGGLGADTMAGGAGDDSYYIDNAGDRVGELAGAGWDAVYASVSFSLRDGVESLFLTGLGNINGAGNGLGNSLTGNAGNNRIIGGAGDDMLAGGHGADTFIFAAGSGADVISDFSAAEGDLIHVRAYSDHTPYGGGITVTQVGTDTVIDLGGGNVVTIQQAAIADVTGHIVW